MTQTEVPAQTSSERTYPGADRRPGFASTAAYFETLAKKTRDDDRKQRLCEVASFYRALAGIVPALPKGYPTHDLSPPMTRAERYRARAEECLTLADSFTDASCRQQLMELAHSYDRMARAAD